MPTEVAPMSIVETAIPGLQQIITKSVSDDRGTIRELFRTSSFAEAGLPVPARWSQINLTWTRRGALRGMHGEPMAKLVGVAAGSAFGAYLDGRKDLPTYGTVLAIPLEVGVQVLVPPGVCNGFQAVSDGGCQYLYCFDEEWRPGLPGIVVNPVDPALGIEWPLPVDPADPSSMSAKDANAPLFADF